jgi:hypothetical protein
MSEFASAILISLGILCVAFLGVACSILADIRYAIRNLQITVNNATPDSRDLDRTVQRAIRRAR